MTDETKLFLATLAERLDREILDEVPRESLGHAPLDQARDQGYRAGWNDRGRSIANFLRSECADPAMPTHRMRIRGCTHPVGHVRAPLDPQCIHCGVKL